MYADARRYEAGGPAEAAPDGQNKAKAPDDGIPLWVYITGGVILLVCIIGLLLFLGVIPSFGSGKPPNGKKRKTTSRSTTKSKSKSDSCSADSTSTGALSTKSKVGIAAGVLGVAGAAALAYSKMGGPAATQQDSHNDYQQDQDGSSGIVNSSISAVAGAGVYALGKLGYNYWKPDRNAKKHASEDKQDKKDSQVALNGNYHDPRTYAELEQLRQLFFEEGQKHDALKKELANLKKEHVSVPEDDIIFNTLWTEIKKHNKNEPKAAADTLERHYQTKVKEMNEKERKRITLMQELEQSIKDLEGKIENEGSLSQPEQKKLKDSKTDLQKHKTVGISMKFREVKEQDTKLYAQQWQPIGDGDQKEDRYRGKRIIIGADFNSNRETEAFKTFTERTKKFLASGYDDRLEKEDRFSAVKMRLGGDQAEKIGKRDRHTIDFSWYSTDHFEVLQTLDYPKASEMLTKKPKQEDGWVPESADERSRLGLPNWHYPSDHFMIGVSYRMKKDTVI